MEPLLADKTSDVKRYRIITPENCTQPLLDGEDENKNMPPDLQELPDMWSLSYIGLYCQYAAVGLLWGSMGALLPFCVYVYDGPSNVCANAKNIVTFAWNIKIFFAILTDTYRPFGMRRKPWMIAGWSMVLVLLLVLACVADQMNITVWLITLMFVQGFVMLSDVPADGYCVEIASLEKHHERGQVLATGQRVRFTFCILAGNLWREGDGATPARCLHPCSTAIIIIGCNYCRSIPNLISQV